MFDETVTIKKLSELKIGDIVCPNEYQESPVFGVVTDIAFDEDFGAVDVELPADYVEEHVIKPLREQYGDELVDKLLQEKSFNVVFYDGSLEVEFAVKEQV
jgi:hypothetical protein